MRCELRVQSSSTADHTETRNTAKVFLWLLGGREIMVRPSHVEDRNHWRATGWWNQRLWKALHTTRFHKLRDAWLTQRRCHAQKNKSFHVTLLSERKCHSRYWIAGGLLQCPKTTVHLATPLRSQLLQPALSGQLTSSSWFSLQSDLQYFMKQHGWETLSADDSRYQREKIANDSMKPSKMKRHQTISNKNKRFVNGCPKGCLWFPFSVFVQTKVQVN